MNRTKATLSYTASNADRLMWYSVEDASNRVLFRGKCYILANTSSVTIDITDIVSGYIYKGYGILNPTWDGTSGGYLQPNSGSNFNVLNNTVRIYGTSIDGSNGEYHIANITLKLFSDSTYTTLVTSTTLNDVYFHSIAPMDYKGSTLSAGNFEYYFDPALLPHLPKIASKNLFYGQLVKNTHNTYGQDLKWVNSNNTLVFLNYTIPAKAAYSVGDTMYAIARNGFDYPDNTVYHNSKTDFPILKLDECPKPYYLMWMNANGGIQSIGLTGKTIYDETHTVNYRVTYDDQSYKANQTLNARWKMKTGLLTDAQYRVLAQSARSPYCLLYITEFDRTFYVNVTTTNVEFKTYSNQGNKLFIGELDIENVERDFVII